jgi:hypothetical protein
MTDVDTGTDPFPTNTQVSGGGYIRKSSLANATTRAWTAIADSRGLYLTVNTDGASTFKPFWFGDINSFSTGVTAWDCMIAIATAANGSFGLGLTDGTVTQKNYLPRLISEAVGAVTATRKGLLDDSANTGLTYPCPVVGGIMASRGIMVHEGVFTSASIRGEMPGYILFMNECASALSRTTPLFLDGFTDGIIALPTGETGSPWIGVSLGDWR